MSFCVFASHRSVILNRPCSRLTQKVHVCFVPPHSVAQYAGFELPVVAADFRMYDVAVGSPTPTDGEAHVDKLTSLWASGWTQ
jgi:hypothetical protein